MPKTATSPAPFRALAGRVPLTLAAPFSNGAARLDSPPDELLVCPWGASPTRADGDVIVDAFTAGALPAEQARLKRQRIALDFEHGTLPGTPAYEESREPRKVAAYGTPEVREGLGIYLVDLDWTPGGFEASRHYHDLSPTPYRDPKGRVTALHSVALVRHGELDGLTYYAADDGDAETETTTPEENAMLKQTLLAVLAALGATLPETATDEEIAAAAAAIIEGKSSAPDPASADPEPAAPAAGEETSEPGPSGMSAEIAGVRARLDRIEREAITRRAADEGKAIPLSAEGIAAMAPDALRDLVSRLEPTVPADRETPLSAEPPKPKAPSPIARACGIKA